VSLGRILHAASVGLRQAVGCEKTYVMLFAEHPRYHHVHVHVVPRMSWFGDEDRGPRVFRFLEVPEDEQVNVIERERVAGELGEAMTRLLA
jgi:galactose-1-phosphate uridylyltransferase